MTDKQTCPTCTKATGGKGHLCVPVKSKDETCGWCGAMIPDERHMCNNKVKKLAYICNSCGRTAVSADYLCSPKKIA
jgi:hypothetical protein